MINSIRHFTEEDNTKNINEMISKLDNKGDISDGDHTFDELYFHRMILTSALFNTFNNRSWKSKLHDDGTMYPNYFIVGIDTDEGSFTYHYHMQYFDYFNKVKEIEKAPKYDGHTSKDVTRLLSLNMFNDLA